jgi:hypothetical protein
MRTIQLPAYLASNRTLAALRRSAEHVITDLEDECLPQELFDLVRAIDGELASRKRKIRKGA